MKKLLFVFMFTLYSGALMAQELVSEIDIIKEMALEEQEIIDAIVLYPKDLRTSIFEASTYPQILIKLSNVQKKTAENYKALMLDYPMEVQQSIWEMTRYPGLIKQLASSPQTAETIIQKQPEAIRDNARLMVKEQYPLIIKIAEMESLSYAAFNKVIEPLPAEGKAVFKKLIQYPEILGLLNENIEFTILGGDLYKKYPEWVEHHADSLNLVIARQQTLELEDWKSQIENDPEAKAELKRATDEFADEYGYKNESVNEEDQEVIDDIYYVEEDEDYDYDEEEYAYEDVEYRIVYRDRYYHYPYWFGYPYWYTYPRWRPYPFWYEWGFYWDSYGGISIYHLPSPFFMHWYFYYPHHHHHYSHLSHHFVNHYYGHRSSRSSITGTVHTWRLANRDVIKDNWTTMDKSVQINTLKEFGQMEKARLAYNEKNPRTPLTKTAYLNKNKGRYPTLEGTVKPIERTKPGVSKPKNDRIIPQKPSKRPDPKTKVKPVPNQPKVSPKPEPRVNPVPQKPTKRKTSKSVEIKKARDYHNQTWTAPKTKTPNYKKSSPRPKPPTVKSKPKTKTRKPN